mgnify:CR=1 FL=1
MTDGHKSDSGKPQLNLIVPGWMWEVALVLSHGAKKYGAGNWKHVESSRYNAALQRHMLQYASGETLDSETGLHHMAHISCSAMFMWNADNKALNGKLPERACKCTNCTGGLSEQTCLAYNLRYKGL